MKSRLTTIAFKNKRAFIYPEHGFQLYGFEEELVDRRVSIIHAPPDGFEPADRRFGNPILFPNPSSCWGPAGEDSWTRDGHHFFMPFHGFARNLYWNVTELEPHAVAAELRPSSHLKHIFPFDFRLRCRYLLSDRGLVLQAEVHNWGNEPYPYALGFHPYLRVPMGPCGGVSDCTLSLPSGTELRSSDGWQSFSLNASPSKSIRASDSLVGSIVLTDTEAPFLEVLDPLNKSSVRVSVESSEMPFPVWVIWSPTPETPYICIEPWTSAPNALNRSTPTLCPPNVCHRFEMTISLRTASPEQSP